MSQICCKNMVKEHTYCFSFSQMKISSKYIELSILDNILVEFRNCIIIIIYMSEGNKVKYVRKYNLAILGRIFRPDQF